MLDTIKVDQFVRFSLSQFREEMGELLEGEVIFIYGPIVQELDDAIRADIEKTKRREEQTLSGGD